MRARGAAARRAASAGPARSTSPRLSGRTTSSRSRAGQSIGGPASAPGCSKRSVVTGADSPFPGPHAGKNESVRIAMVTGRADPGRDGVADYTAHLVRALGEAGTTVDPVPTDGSLRDLVATALRLRASRPDVVHVQFAPSAFGFRPWPGLLPDLGGAPVVTTVHEYGWWSAPSWVPGPVWRAVERTGR